MAEGADPESKTEEATPRKLEEARKKGDVAKSQDVASALSLLGAAAVVLTLGGYFAGSMADQMVVFIARPHELMGGFDAGAGVEIATRMVWMAAPIMAAVMAATIVGGAGGNLIQSGLIFSAEKLKPKWEKINPLEGFKRIFGPDGLVQFLKTLLKLIAIAAVCWWVLRPHLREFENLAAMSPAAILPLARDLAFALLAMTLAFLAVAAAGDYLWQRLRFAKRMRMTKEEVKEDFKQSEGDPHVKARLRQIRMQRSRKRMMQAVPTATVVVTNPTHYSVALRYDPDKGDGAPVCVAKGVDALALKIREVAREHGVEVIENVPLARALYATVEVDDVIPKVHFEAVAKIIGFVMQKRRRR
ncbi:flagellar biosynthesis protein FlhB [Brevundimonas balnearis]|uniref:Flagellar biosynthetic protein FlhB n=1 Tax=Brevundimonas balnearis TaxID=1572858 RepID=A0ABV6R5M4_9CAUL